MLEIQGKYTTAIVFTNLLDDTSKEQISKIVDHQAFTEPVAIMPDVHAGASNSVIGFTMPLSESIIPNTVGVDIGCGMLATHLTIVKDIDFANFDKALRKAIPIGNSHNHINKNPVIDFAKAFWYDKASDVLYFFTKNFNKKFGTKYTPIEYNYRWFENLCSRIGADRTYIENSIATLGGGNHFIEIGKDSRDNTLWLTIHTGSRQLGKLIADYHSRIAKKICNANVPKQMEFLKGKEMYDYFVDMVFAQVYASQNRHLIAQRILEILKSNSSEQIESTHNYIDFDDMIIRKGAIASYKGRKMIIPFNMADGILICEGKSNKKWNFSAPHGAGRLLSRTKAFENLDLNQYRRIMQERGIFTTSVSKDTLDEAPMAYKPAEEIEKAIEDTANIIFRIKPVYNLKSA